MAAYYRGVVKTGSLSAEGLFQAANVDTTVDVETAQDEKGNTAVAQQVDPKAECGGECVLDTSATVFDALVTAVQAQGASATPSTLTMGTVKYIVTALGKSETNRGYRRGTWRGIRYTKNGIPA
jgi:hypothetical protein